MFKKIMILIFGDVYKELELCKDQIKNYKIRIVNLQLKVKRLRSEVIKNKILKSYKKKKKIELKKRNKK